MNTDLDDQLDSGEDFSEDDISESDISEEELLLVAATAAAAAGIAAIAAALVVTQKLRAPSMSLKRYFPSAGNADQTAQKKAKQSQVQGPLSFYIYKFHLLINSPDLRPSRYRQRTPSPPRFFVAVAFF